MTPADIRARIAASDGSDQGEILEATFDSFVPQPPNGREHLEDAMRWIAVREKMQTFLRAQSHTDAALLIAEAALPGWGSCIEQERPTCICTASWSPAGSEPWGSGSFNGEGQTRALAILDAICAAKGG